MIKAIYKTNKTSIDTVTDIIPEGNDSTTTALLSYGVNVIITATTSDFCVKLPQPTKGKKVTILNRSDIYIKVYPSNSGGDINGIVDGSFTIKNDGISYDFVCYENPLPGGWSTNATPLSSIVSDFPVWEVSHTGGTDTQAAGTYQYLVQGVFGPGGGIGIGGGIDIDSSMYTIPSENYWHTYPVRTFLDGLTVRTNILAEEMESGGTLSFEIMKVSKFSENGVTSGAQGGGASWGGNLVGDQWISFSDAQMVPVGAAIASNPAEIGDQKTIYGVIPCSSYVGPQDSQYAPFSNHYYLFKIYIPDTYPTKIYKFQFELQTQ